MCHQCYYKNYLASLFLVLLFITTAIGWTKQSWAEQSNFKVSTFPNEGLFGEAFWQIIQIAYQQAGFTAELVHLPGSRSIVEVNKGNLDAELYRVKGINEKFTNLIPVPTVVMPTEIVVLSRTPINHIRNWEDLAPYSVGIMRGFKLAEKKTQGMRVKWTPSISNSLILLANKKLDLALSSRLNAIDIIKKDNIEGLIINEPPLTKLDLYHYLHKKHQAIVPKLDQALKTMHETGQIKRIVQKTIEEYR